MPRLLINQLKLAVLVFAVTGGTIAFSDPPPSSASQPQADIEDAKALVADIELAEKRKIEAEQRAQSEEKSANRADNLARIHRKAAAQAREEAAAWAQVESTARARHNLYTSDNSKIYDELSDKDKLKRATNEIFMLLNKNWHLPASTKNGMVATVAITLLPNGEVSSATIHKSSGVKQFDDSAVNAVYRAIRFPTVAGLNLEVFERSFRKFLVIFRPEGLRQN